jgi:signal transduction histidine kinase
VQPAPTHAPRPELTRTWVRPLALAVALEAALLVLWLVDRNALFWIDHTDQVISQAELVERLVVDDEARARADVATLAEREPGRRSFSGEIGILQFLVSDNPAQTALAAEIARDAGRWSLALRQAVSSGDRTALGAALDRTESLRAKLESFVDVERRLRDARLRRSRISSFVAILGTVALTSALAITFAVLGRRSVDALAGQYDALVAAIEQERRELEHRVAERTAELTAANRELEAFSYSVSHDLRAPLRAIDGFSQALAEDYAGKLGAEADDYIARIRRATKRMGELIDALLQLARIARAPLRRGDVDVSAVARSVLEDLRHRDPERQVDAAIEPGLRAFGDANLVRIVLENLLANAWKFTRGTERPRIEVGADANDGETAFYVRDNGAGFDPRHAAQLFQPFQRLHRLTEFEGSGVGLATVQRIVHRHRGRVWAESRPGQGATFHFTLGSQRGARDADIVRRKTARDGPQQAAT